MKSVHPFDRLVLGICILVGTFCLAAVVAVVIVHPIQSLAALAIVAGFFGLAYVIGWTLTRRL